jgi:hypothetical protein
MAANTITLEDIDQQLNKKLQKLLSDSAIGKLREQLAQFDTFKVLKVERYELRHTTTLSWLLDPNQNHNLGDSFLQYFLKELFGDRNASDPRYGFYTGSIDEVAIHPEFPIALDGTESTQLYGDAIHNDGKNRKSGELDVLIEGPTWAIAIEAKIDSKEGKKQLHDYTSHLKQRFENKALFLLYLTVKPEPEVLEKNPQWIGIQWGEQVRKALKAALGKKYQHSHLAVASEERASQEHSLKEFLFRYLALLERLSDELHGVPETVQAIADANYDTLVALQTELLRKEKEKFPILPWSTNPCWAKPYWKDRLLLTTLIKYLRPVTSRFTAEVIERLIKESGRSFTFLTPERSKNATIRLYPDEWHGCLYRKGGVSVPIQELMYYHAEFRKKDIEFKLYLPETPHWKLQQDLVQELERWDREVPMNIEAHEEADIQRTWSISSSKLHRDRFVGCKKPATLKLYTESLYWTNTDTGYELKEGESAKLHAIRQAIDAHTALLSKIR